MWTASNWSLFEKQDEAEEGEIGLNSIYKLVILKETMWKVWLKPVDHIFEDQCKGKSEADIAPPFIYCKSRNHKYDTENP